MPPSVALVVDRLQDYQLPLVRGLEEELHSAGSPLRVVVIPPWDRDGDAWLARLVGSGAVEGVVISAMVDSRTGPRRVADLARQARGVPVVTLGNRIAGLPDVCCDNAGGITAAVDHLVLEGGRRRLLMVAGHTHSTDSEERVAAFRARTAELGLDAAAVPVVWAGFDREAAYRATSEVLTGGAVVDGVLAANDAMALGAMDALAEHGLEVPRDVAVVGFDNSCAAARSHPALTSVDQDLQHAGRTAARLVLDQLAGRSVPAITRTGHELVRRESSAVVDPGSDAEAPVTDRRGGGSTATPGTGDPGADVTQHLLGLSRALSGAEHMDDVADELAAHLPRLGVRRAFVATTPDGDDVSAPTSVGAVVVRSIRSVGLTGGRRAVSHEVQSAYPLDRMLPDELASELRGGTLVVQRLVVEGQERGLLLHEQHSPDRHTAESLHLDITRAMEAISRRKQLRRHARELEGLVTQRTAALQVEVAARQVAEEDLRRANQELRGALLVDGLTGLANRPALDEVLERHWARHERIGEPLSLLMCDVDHFKAYNDTLGHLEGDDCLRQVAACVQASITRREDVAARFGGEEFALVLPGTDEPGARIVAHRLLEAVRAAGLPHPGRVPGAVVSISIGVASAPGCGARSHQDLVRAADVALYRAKADGRDRVIEAVPDSVTSLPPSSSATSTRRRHRSAPPDSQPASAASHPG